ncbi:MAG: Rho termination factor N-terminal domain-containing protein [Promethearchaeia archaeon]
MARKIDDKKYLNYLFQSLNVKELKEICKQFSIRGYSKLKKTEIIDLILDSLADEELQSLLKQKENEIVFKQINLAFKKISGNDPERVSEIKIINEKEHEIEIVFKGLRWETKSYLSITPKNIDDPDRDCDCKAGSNFGLCPHFWTGFIFMVKNGWIKLKDWNMTPLPEDFEERIKNIELKLSEDSESEQEKTLKIMDTSSIEGILMNYIDSRITIYEAEITKITERKSEFQDIITTFYIVELKNIKFGPQIKRKADFKEENIQNIETLRIRLSEKAYYESDIKEGDKISCNGTLNKDNFWGLILKRVTKLNKL